MFWIMFGKSILAVSAISWTRAYPGRVKNKLTKKERQVICY